MFSVSKSAQVEEEEEMKRATMQPLVTGSVAGNVYETVLNLTAKQGILYEIGMSENTSNIATARITLDGVILGEYNTTSIDLGLPKTPIPSVIPYPGANQTMYGSFNVEFSTSLKIEIKGNVAEGITSYAIYYGLDV